MADHDTIRDALQQMVDAFSPYAWGSIDSKRDALNAATDALASPPVAVQEEGDAWQPIETAPKDGKEFLAIWERQGNLMQVVRWNTVHKFYQAKGEPILGFSSNATAWQPLPSPPAAMKGDQP